MLSVFRIPASATALMLMTACQMDTGTARPDFATMQAERLANTMTIVETCRASECARLNLDSGLLEDYTSIVELSHVTAVMMSYTNFGDLDQISAMSQLRELHIGQTNVTDLSGLTNFPNLRVLHAQDLDVTDYSAIAGLRSLEELAVGGSGVTDIAFVSTLANLKTLNISRSYVTDLSPLAGLQRLETLDMMGMDLPDDLTPLLRIRNLKSISISDWGTATPAQQTVLDQLDARGVEILREVVAVVC